MSSSFRMPGQIVSGWRALESDEAKEIFSNSGGKAFIVTGPNMVKLGSCLKLEAILKAENIDYEIFSDVNGEPTDKMVAAGLQAYKENGCDFFIGLGGGSPLDLMKAIGALVENGGSISDYMGKEITSKIPRMIAIPTTAGTGSEATQFTIITDTKCNIKMLLRGRALMPDYVILDPQFAMTSPPSVTAGTGLDALCHCVEAYTSKKAQTMSDTFAISAVKRIFKYLPVCYRDGHDEEARMQMSFAALEAGIAFNNASVTIIHGMSRPIGALFHIPHGISNAMLMDECLTYALSGAYEQFAILGREIGVADEQDDDETASKKFLSAITHLKEELKIPTLETYGINKEDYWAVINKMAQDAIDSGSPANTRRTVTKKDIEAIYRRVM